MVHVHKDKDHMVIAHTEKDHTPACTRSAPSKKGRSSLFRASEIAEEKRFPPPSHSASMNGQ